MLAGKQENQKIVSLDVVLANNNIIIWENPDDDGDSENDMYMLIFIRELDTYDTLEILMLLQLQTLTHFFNCQLIEIM